MPIYEYACQKCGHQFEALQKASEGPLRKCPGCGALRLKKMVSAPQFRLKGSGWYETDFKKDGKRKLAGDAAQGDAKGDAGRKDGDGKKEPAAEAKGAEKKDAGAEAPKKPKDKPAASTGT